MQLVITNYWPIPYKYAQWMINFNSRMCPAEYDLFCVIINNYMNPLFFPQLSMWVMKEALLPTFRITGKVRFCDCSC